MDSVQGVRVVDGNRVAGRAHGDATWEGGRGETELVSYAPWQGTEDILDGPPNRRKTVELPGWGLSGTRDDEDVNADTLYPPACPGYCGRFEGGKPPPPTVTPMQYSGPLACYEWEAPWHRPVRPGGGSEANAVGRGGTAGDLGEGLSGLWRTFGKCDGVQISGKGDDGARWWLNGSGRQPVEGEEEYGADVENFEPGGGGPEGIRALFQSGSTGGASVRGRDMGPDPPVEAIPE